MPSRRLFLKSGLGAYAAGAMMPALSRQASVAPYYRAIFDERFEAPRIFAAGAAKRRIQLAAIRGDVTSLFFNDLDLRWKQGPVLLAGYTTQASLFCLDLLARDRGMRVSHCVTNPNVETALAALDGAPPRLSPNIPPAAGAPSALVFWIITPRAREAMWGSFAPGRVP